MTSEDKPKIISQGPIGWNQDFKDGKLGGHTPLMRVGDVLSIIEEIKVRYPIGGNLVTADVTKIDLLKEFRELNKHG